MSQERDTDVRQVFLYMYVCISLSLYIFLVVYALWLFSRISSRIYSFPGVIGLWPGSDWTVIVSPSLRLSLMCSHVFADVL